ncbi:MAG: AMP-binding protein, partial [Nocardioides sp.]
MEVWLPPPNVREISRLGEFATWLEADRGLRFDSYPDLHRWSVDELGEFWTALWEFSRIPHTGSRFPALPRAEMPFAEWFPNARVNFAEAMLAMPGRADGDRVVLSRSETRGDESLTAAELRDRVARARAGLRALGVGAGDRVAAYLPNIPEALVLLLATAGLGAIFTSCPPEFGVTNVTERWTQIEPSVIVAIDGYRYGGKAIDKRAEVTEIAARLGLADRVVWLGYLEPAVGPSTWDAVLNADPEAVDRGVERVPFAHPLWVLFTSGTTGRPKPIVHGHGGIALEFFKSLALQSDL